MDQYRNLADDRLIVGCVYCGGYEETRDHVPSRVLLDAPLPENLPVVWACASCNNGFSRDEEYFACLIESVIAGSTDPERIRRPRVAELLRRAPALRARLEAAKSIEGNEIRFAVEEERVRRVIVKLARGHAAFDLSQPCKKEPTSVSWMPLALMSKEQRDAFNDVHIVRLSGEIGSRNQQRLRVVQLTLESESGKRETVGALINDWVDVQEDRYRYLAIDEFAIRIRMVIAEYLACEVVWGE